MIFEISRSFGFEAAHTLNREIEADASRRIHGHSYRAIVTLRGEQISDGMLVDLGHVQRHLSRIRDDLDHTLLNDVPGLPQPTLEQLCVWIWRRLLPDVPQLHRVTVRRDSLDEQCSYMAEKG